MTPRRAWLTRRRAAFALPFVVGPLALRALVAPLGDHLAKDVAVIAPALATSVSSSAASAAGPDVPFGGDPRVAEIAGLDDGSGLSAPPRRTAVLASPARRQGQGHDGRRDGRDAREAREANDAGALRDGGADASAPRATVVVPASVVSKAIERRDVGAVNAVGPDGAAVGARLVGVSKYEVGLRDGDVVVSVAGTRTPNVATMTSVAMSAAAYGATHLRGTVQRGDTLVDVVLELPR